ncbi:MAG TPA: hypothetical protein VGJ95_13075 [Pseudonocardiaceae bacterium]|jgi:hypothetical protein
MAPSTDHPLGRPLSVADRCDRCGARAAVLAILHGGGTLLFCGHHARVHHSALEQVAHCFVDPQLPSLHPAAEAALPGSLSS